MPKRVEPQPGDAIVSTPKRGDLVVPGWAAALDAAASPAAAAEPPTPVPAAPVAPTAAPAPAAAPQVFDLVAPDGRRMRLTVPPGVSQAEVMQRAAALATAESTIGPTPAPGLGQQIRDVASQGARPLTPGGAPVSPAGALAEAATDPEVLLGTAGELAGMASPVPGGGILGAAAGGAAGRAVKRGLSGQPTNAADLATAAGVQGAGAGVGRVIAGLGTGAVRGLIGGATRETNEAAAARTFLEPRLKKTGVNLVMTPAEATESSVLDLMQNVAEGGFFSRNRMMTYFANRREGLKRVADDFLDEIAPHLEPAQLADVFVDGVNGRNTAAILTSNGLRAQFDARAGHIIAQMGRLRRYAKTVIEASARRGHVEAAREGVPIAEQVFDLPQTMRIGDLAQLRSSLLEAKRAQVAGERVPLGKRRVVDKLIAEVDDLVERSVTDPQTLMLWRDSNALVKERHMTTDSAFLKKLVRISDPTKLGARGGGAGGDALVDKIFANENSIRATVAALGPDSPEWAALQRRYTERAFAGATDTQGNINGEKLLDTLVGKDNIAQARFTAAFPKADTRQNMIHFADALRTIQKQAGDAGGSGRMLIQLTQGGALIGAMGALATGSLAGAGGAGTIATTLIAPSIMAEMLTRKPMARLLLTALNTPPTAKVAASLVSRLAAAAEQIKEQHAIDDFLASVPGAGQGSVRTTTPTEAVPQ